MSTGKKTFYQLYPELLLELSKEDQITAKEKELVKTSKQKFTWNCQKGHTWYTTVNSRVMSKVGCPKCYRQRINPTLLEANHPLLKEIDKSEYEHAKDLTLGSEYKVTWKCNKGHTWKASIYDKIKERTSCPDCRKIRHIEKEYSEKESLEKMHPEFVKELHPDYKNRKQCHYRSRLKVKWICSNNHIWESSIELRSLVNPECPKCLFNQKYPTLLEINHPILKEMSKETYNEVKDLSVVSAKKIEFICPKGHKYNTSIRHRTKNGSRCPYCVGQKTNEDNCLAVTHPEIAKQLREDNKEMAYKVSYGTQKKLWWVCNEGHQWQAPVLNRVNNRGCPFCNEGSLHISNLKDWLVTNKSKWVDKTKLEKEGIFNTLGLKQNLSVTRHLMEIVLNNEVLDKEIIEYLEGKDNIVKIKLEEFKPGQYGKRNKPACPQDIREQVYKIKGRNCLVCGTDQDIQMDHIIPSSKGGSDDPENLQPLCYSHNLMKSNKNLSIEDLKEAVKAKENKDKK